jgi:hypothetical protein
MSYEKDLVFNLRLRGLPEDQIMDALSEVKAHTLSTGAPPESEFGTAEEYALTFPKTKRPTRGRGIMVSAFALAVVFILIVARPSHHYRRHTHGLFGRLPAPDSALQLRGFGSSRSPPSIAFLRTRGPHPHVDDESARPCPIPSNSRR